MPISVQCPSCKKNLKVRLQAAGRSVKCPGCSTTIHVPKVHTQHRSADGPAPTASSLEVYKGQVFYHRHGGNDVILFQPLTQERGQL